jgi:2-keto-4-pentenoate hydratase/2-oxohepta-3-ene-1,7-dioic acid hydratase in catechol pathway
LTGTPAGVGMARGRFLQPGDVIEVEVDNIGILKIQLNKRINII